MTGLDAEHRPCSNILTKESISLLQLATRDKVFVLDMNALRTALSAGDWAELNSRYFCNPAVTILGYGLSGDLQLIARSLPEHFPRLLDTAQGVLELELLDRRLCSASEGFLLTKPHALDDQRGLNGLVESLFGRPLDKRHQVSYWDRRPLTEAQVWFYWT